MNRTQRLVVCAAVKLPDGFVVVGIRHFSPDMRASLAKMFGDDWHQTVKAAGKEQGFVDQWGVFMDREEAWKVAEAANQIRFNVSCEGTLYSENLY